MTASWKTTVGGILTAIGLILTTMADPYHTIGLCLAAVGAVFTGVTARDNNVTSEQAKAGQ